MEERKEEGERIPPPPSLPSSGRLLDWRKRRGGRVVVTAYCLSSVRCGSSLSVHLPRPGYLYPLNIHAGGGRLQSFSSLHTLWRRCIKESACCERACLYYFSFRISPFTFGQCWVLYPGLYAVLLFLQACVQVKK